MSLLASVTQPSGNASAAGAPQYYFSLDSTPADPIVTAPAFEAIGTGTPSNGGSISIHAQDLTGAGADAVVLQSALGVPRVAIGLNGVEAGTNSGSNMAVFTYADDGSFLAAPLQIVRATGGVIMPVGLNTAQALVSGLTTTESLIVGDGTEVGGGVAQINGTRGVATIYDNIYHRPNGGMEVINTTFGPTGVMLTNPTYTPGNTGTYSVTMEITADAAGYAWTNGVALIMGYFSSPFPPFPILSDGFLTCDSLANPTGIVLPTGGGGIINNVYKKDIVAIVTLQQGVAYAAQISSVGGFNLGTTGGIAFYIQPLLA